MCITSPPKKVRLFLKWLGLCQHPNVHISYCVHIHMVKCKYVCKKLYVLTVDYLKLYGIHMYILYAIDINKCKACMSIN